MYFFFIYDETLLYIYVESYTFRILFIGLFLCFCLFIFIYLLIYLFILKHFYTFMVTQIHLKISFQPLQLKCITLKYSPDVDLEKFMHE